MYCQIQSYTWWAFFILFSLSINLPWWWIQDVLSIITNGIILFRFFVLGGYRSRMRKTRSIERHARRLYRRHTKYKGLCRQALPRPRQITHPRRKKYDGWGSPLPPCQELPSSAPTTSKILSQFLASHDPSLIVHYIFDNVIKRVSKRKRG